ncbi:MAG: type II CRISPR RNA-guided endonuclease Cas9 [Bacteroidales bacterium]|jgi:CRISPR-associated endonuclease Csn1|nr:type II CRISPR RNA-guided endonuclease Cas9 [Bacteroidales bacterium]
MKKILGLDLGTNSIGWALIDRDFEKRIDNVLGSGNILGMGSRIIPMSQDVLDKFGQGQSYSQTAERTGYRGVRRLRQRFLLRRERLHRVLNIIGALPSHYKSSIDFEDRKGQFIDNAEAKLTYFKNEEGNYEFLFKSSFEEMLREFKVSQPDLFYAKENGKETKIPYDWTIYYLRKKALIKKISLEELAWLLLNFNQKRGYYQLRGEEEEVDKTKRIEFYALKVVGVSAEEANYKKEIWYNVELENGWFYRRKSKVDIIDWVGKIKEFIVTTTLNEDGTIKTDKEGVEKRSFKAVNSEEDWIAIKKSTEEKIENSKQFVGSYIYNTLLKNPTQKINGKLVKTIERHFYKDELSEILKKQIELNPELQNKDLLRQCVNELYSNNYAQQNILKDKDFLYLFVNDIIFYQRPLKSKKSLIDGCNYETRTYFNKKENEYVSYPIKVIAKSNPLFQEYRVWQFVENIRIYQKEKLVDGKLTTDYDVTEEFLPTEDDKVKLFEFFNDKEKIKQNQFLSYYKLKENKYRWNYVEDKEYPLNETRALIISKFKKHKEFDWQSFLNQENEIKLWHLLYSISDKKELERAFDNEKFKLDFPIELRQDFKNIKPFKKDYGALSEKAIKKLLPLMRMGKYWNYDNIDEYTKDRIAKILDAEYDEKIKDRIREKAIKLTNENDFKALPLWLASYIVYDRHSESGDVVQWKNPDNIDQFLHEFKQHSLRNPIVEQVITETLRVVKDIWNHYGNGEEKFFDEIHVELGRDMKNPKDVRERMTKSISKNQDTKHRIRTLLYEFKNQNIEGVIPHSPSQQDKLKIFEEDILSSVIDIPDDIEKISKSAEPTAKEIEKYRLWLEQKYRSPYTGQVIPLSKLFTTEYEIEHIIPQARYFDDSYGNKIICEAEVNRFKDRQTAFEMISKNPGQIIELGQGRQIKLFDVESYQEFVTRNFKSGSKKHKILLSEDVPEQFISRQLNDTRYISKVVKSLLSNIVREENEQEVTSKNVVPVTGSATTQLKRDWGLNDKWNELIAPRFERMNHLITKEGEPLKTDFGFFDEKKNFYRIQVPYELKKNFNPKRIDHRHHAMDALVIACATRNHIGYLSNEHAKSKNKRYDLRNKLRRLENIQINGNAKKIAKEFLMPWDNFPIDAKRSLENIVVSFKQNLRVINKASNKYQVWKNEDALLKKGKRKQENGENWAIRKPLHKETVSGRVSLRFKKTVSLNQAIEGDFIVVDKKLSNKIKSLRKQEFDSEKIKKYFKEKKNVFNENNVSKIEVYYTDNEYSATRKVIDESFNSKKIQESVTDTGIQKILLNQLKIYNETDEKGEIKERPDLAFSSDCLDEMNKHITVLNGGKDHKPIYKVRIYEKMGNKFAAGLTGNKKDKFVEAAKGTNLYFAVYEGLNKKGEKVRQYDTIPLNVVIERLKQGDNPVPEKYFDKDNFEYQLLFSLSPNDLVYIPTEEEQDNINSIDFENLSIEFRHRLFVVNDFTGVTCYFTPNRFAKNIGPKELDTSFDSKQSKYNGFSIKEVCQKLKVDRLGQIVKVSEY